MPDQVQYIKETFTYADTAGWRGPGWYFWDETGAYCHGPYLSYAEADRKFLEYAKELEGSSYFTAS